MGLTTICENNFYHEENVGNVRKAQEDSHGHMILTPNGDLFVVCDGMGGHVGGKKASSIAVSCIIEYLNREEYLDIPAALDAALQYANMQILGYAQTNPEFRGMGTTACIVLLHGDKAYIAHVGDSRIYLHLGKEKQLHRVTKDESFVQKLVDIGEITDDEAESHPNKNRILNALGIKPNMMTNFQVIEPKNGDTFMICSDGLNGMVKDAVIEQCLNSDDVPLETKGKSLINMALQNGGLDNVTVELIHIDNSPHKKSIFISYNPQNRKSKGGKSPKDSKKKNLLITWLTIILSVVLLVLSAFAVYVFMNNSEEEEVVNKTDEPSYKDYEEYEEYKEAQTVLGKLESKCTELQCDIDTYKKLPDNDLFKESLDNKKVSLNNVLSQYNKQSEILKTSMHDFAEAYKGLNKADSVFCTHYLITQQSEWKKVRKDYKKVFCKEDGYYRKVDDNFKADLGSNIDSIIVDLIEYMDGEDIEIPVKEFKNEIINVQEKAYNFDQKRKELIKKTVESVNNLKK